MGSSPRMRGTHVAGAEGVEQSGIIPAYAGNTANPRRFSTCGRDHPRVCGEHDGADRTLSVSTGSSPRMRGTPAVGAADGGFDGIIPAYAGNTKDLWPSYRGCRDHPRVCGEHKIGKEPMLFDTGSSPRMRGTLSCQVPHGASAGIIPAYAGNTSTPRART